MNPVIICAFDGLQLSQVTPQLMPNLAGFAAEGFTFGRHHPVFPSVTRLNAASMLTGCYPGRHGIAGNRMVFRELDPHRLIDVLEPNLNEINRETNGGVLLVPTLGERLAESGLKQVSIVSGTSGNAFCHNPNAAKVGGAVIHTDFSLPGNLHSDLEKRYGKWPESEIPNTPRLKHATKLLLEYVLPEVNPAVAFIWYSEPDTSHHTHGLGSHKSKVSLMHADNEFGRLLDSLSASGLEDKTNILVVSDHGYSTVIESVDIEQLVLEAGFNLGGQPGGVTVAPNGGSALFYVLESEPETARSLFTWLTSKPWCGSVFASKRVDPIEGAFPGSLIGIDGPRGPDIAISMRWNQKINQHGYRGHSYTSGGLLSGNGDHGSASASDMHNMLIARGPSLQSGITSNLPSGNVDITPTVLKLLGLPIPENLDGRVLEEALADNVKTNKEIGPSTLTSTAEVIGDNAIFRQSVTLSKYNGVTYMDEGSAVLESR